ncbi:hypothetical protein [Actinocrispum wychmicini]|uniref:hypothetical protein n=1 Tax=Actinocrispum wychmicini TaxID=1213861 RepID=UPI00104CD28E|nr:hypothetical protein [Actinocrispum wychmicini]
MNQPSNLLDRIIRIEKRVEDIWKKVGLASAVIRRGGLTLLDDAYLRMVDDNNTEIVYIGPDQDGKQIIRIRRDSGADVLFTYTAGGRQFWALTDNARQIVVSDDAVSGQGIARPWLPIPVQTSRYDHLPSTPLTDWDQLQNTGYRPKQHPLWSVLIKHCTTAPDTKGEVRLVLDGVQVGTTIPVEYYNTWAGVGPFPVPGTHMSAHILELQARRTAGTGRVGASMAVEGLQS